MKIVNMYQKTTKNDLNKQFRISYQIKLQAYPHREHIHKITT